jgi:hypothetical protein
MKLGDEFRKYLLLLRSLEAVIIKFIFVLEVYQAYGSVLHLKN